MGLFDRFKKKETEKTPDGNTASFAELKDEILPAAEAEETAEAAPEAENEEPAEAESAAPAETAAEEEAPAPAPAPVPQGPRMTLLTKEQIEKSEESG